MDPSTRIISHMNKDHQLALTDYLVVYGGVRPDFDQSSPQITAIDDISMQISYVLADSKSQSKRFKWNEIHEDENVKVTSMKDLKAKLVAMAKYAAAQQGYSHVTVQKYPKFTGYLLFMIVLFTGIAIGCYDKAILIGLLSRDPVSLWVYGHLPEMCRQMLKFIAEHIRVLGGITVGVHVGEVVGLMVPLVRKYRVGLARAAWCAAVFFEGFPAVLEFKKNIR